MLKNKIKEIIYSDDLSNDEIEFYCHYERGDRYDYGTYGAGWEFNSDSEEQACYDARIEEMANNIIDRGASWTLSLPLCEESNRLNMAIIRYLKTLAKDEFVLKELDNILNS